MDTSPSGGFAALANEHSTVITTSNTEFSSLPSKGVSKKVSRISRGKKSRKRKANGQGTTLTINEYYIENISGNTVINLPKTNDSIGTDFYTTPDNTTHKGDGSTERVFSDGNQLDRETKGFGAKTTTSRALDFGGRVPSEEDELSKTLVSVAPQTGTRHSLNQSRIPYPLRKRIIKGKASLSDTKRWHHGNGGHTHSIENHLHVARNDGCLIVGINNNICFKEKCFKELEGAEVVEVDGAYPLISPQKTLKVPADENSENFISILQDIINCLHPLRDRGRYEEFYIEAKDFAEAHSSEQHIQILLLIEQSITLSYQKEFAKSKKVVDEQIRKISKPGVKMKNFLLAYCHVHLTGLSRRQNRLTEADKHVCTARQIEEFIPFGIVRAFVVYEEASNLTKMLSLMNVDKEEPSAWQIKKEDARRILKECISFSKRIHEDNSAIYLQRGHFCLLKLALMNLNCRTRISRTQPVDEESITEAEQCINQMEECEGNMSAALSVQFYTAKGDLSLRKQDFLQARRLAQQALRIAEDNNIRLEIKAIKERLEDINQLLT